MKCDVDIFYNVFELCFRVLRLLFQFSVFLFVRSSLSDVLGYCFYGFKKDVLAGVQPGVCVLLGFRIEILFLFSLGTSVSETASFRSVEQKQYVYWLSSFALKANI